MKKIGVAILGLGVVGSGTYRILTEKKEYFQKTQKIDVTVESVLEKFRDRALGLGVPEENIAANIEEVVSNPHVDVVCEVMGGVEPARTFVLTALRAGKTVVTSNKELFCKHWHELEAAAKKSNAGLYFEASCVGGVPIIRTLIDGMQANKVQTLMGIINGTTNYILTKMADEGLEYADALRQAQELGYAEKDPTADVEGYDASYKLSILSSLAFCKKVPLNKVYREGITKISKADLDSAKSLGYVVKLLGIGKQTEKGVEVRVHPTFIPKNHPLAVVNDSFNAVHLVGDAVGDIMLYGRGAGSLPTASAIVSDVIYAAKHDPDYVAFKNVESDSAVKFASDFVSSYFIRMSVKDSVGVLSKVTGIFAKQGVSVKDVIQNARGESSDVVPLIFITHQTHEKAVRRAIEKIASCEEIVSVDSVIHVEN